MKKIVSVCLALAAFGGAAPALAVPVTYVFTGVLRAQDPGLEPYGVGSYLSGQQFSGSIVLDDVGIDTSASPGQGYYLFNGPAYSASFQIGSDTFGFGGQSSALLYDGSSVGDNDAYQAGTRAPSGPVTHNGAVAAWASAAFFSATFYGNGLPGYVLSEALLFPGYLSNNIFGLSIRPVGQSSAPGFSGTFTSFAAVPLPAGLPLLGAALAGLSLLGRRKRSISG